VHRLNPKYVDMRLLNAETKELVQFLPNKIPPYAILSHTWSSDPNEEVLFLDIGKEEAKPAYEHKVAPACKKALKRGFGYVWIDTCCIDKSSSAELQEAINSMFNWYSQSSICFVYLEDVPSKADESTDSEIEDDLITESRWFTRGWTLQELIAPGNVIFYSKSWDKLGTRESLASSISEKTKIGKGILAESRPGATQYNLSSRSVANRMSWAAFRETTRPEDIAYCLLGIFDVNMPLLYGEGEKKAFHRLQEEILKNSDDQSLLAWTAPRLDRRRAEEFHDPLADRRRAEEFHGPLAKHPIEFQDASNIAPLPGVPDTYFLTSSGLRIDLLVVPSDCLPFQKGVWGVLRCHYANDFTGPLAIPLEPLPWQGSQVYARKNADLITIDRSKLTNRDIFQNGPFAEQDRAYPQNQTIIIHRNPKPLTDDCESLYLESWPNDCTLIQAIPEKRWNSESRIMISDDYDVTHVFIFEHVSSKTRFAVVFGYSFRFPEPTLAQVKVFKLDPGMLSSKPWLQHGKSVPWMDWEWEDEHYEDQVDTAFWYDSKGVGQGVGAALRKGHIMGVPFFVINIERITGSAAEVGAEFAEYSD
jgi:hypothetical protein